MIHLLSQVTMLKKQSNKHGKGGVAMQKLTMCCICYKIGYTKCQGQEKNQIIEN